MTYVSSWVGLKSYKLYDLKNEMNHKGWKTDQVPV